MNSQKRDKAQKEEKNGGKESRAYKSSEEITIWNFHGPIERPCLSALHIVNLKIPEAQTFMELPQQPRQAEG